jgi:lysophospholipase L1-like esterase
LVLLGDSVFDNKAYVKGGRDVISHLREQMQEGWKATLTAIDGNRVEDVSAQLVNVPADATHLFVSVGGNDALDNAGILQKKFSSSAEVFCELFYVASAFEERYKKMLKAVLQLNKPTTVCTIYFPRFEESLMQKTAVSALSSFNDAITRQAFIAGLPLIDLRLICNKDADYANPIEPSEAGGVKIAKAILQVTNEHNFEKRRTTVYSVERVFQGHTTREKVLEIGGMGEGVDFYRFKTGGEWRFYGLRWFKNRSHEEKEDPFQEAFHTLVEAIESVTGNDIVHFDASFIHPDVRDEVREHIGTVLANLSIEDRERRGLIAVPSADEWVDYSKSF